MLCKKFKLKVFLCSDSLYDEEYVVKCGDVKKGENGLGFFERN